MSWEGEYDSLMQQNAYAFYSYMVWRSVDDVMSPHRRLLFLDIDGTVVDGTPREALMEERGLVVGEYGDVNRSYPRGYEAFINGFNDPSLFHLDTNIPDAEQLIQAAVEADATVLFLTARDARHHCGTESDLKQRGLWRDGMRLICKPHRELVDKAEFKERMIAMLSQNDETEDVVLIDNNRKNTARVQERLSFVTTYSACSEAHSHIQGWNDANRSGDA